MKAKTEKQDVKSSVCYVLSYRDPGYIRTRVITKALDLSPKFDLHLAINRRKSILRYPESLLRLVLARVKHKPDIYILGFRGHELYWLVKVLTFPKPIIFDEFINMQDWLVYENKKIKKHSILAKVARQYVRSILLSASLVLADTQLHAQSSSKSYNVSMKKYKAIHVGADEDIFYPRPNKKIEANLEVFFYGNLAPLHGFDYILEAANMLKGQPVYFTLIGGRGRPVELQRIKDFMRSNKLTNVTHTDWLDFDSLPEKIATADLCLGGPYGNTLQSRRVITGKTYQFMAMGKATVIGDIQEKVGFIDKKNCLLIKQGSVKSIVEAIHWSLNNRDKLNDIGFNAREFYEKNFSTNAISAELTEALEDITD